MREYLANGCVIALSLAFAWHFSNIWRYGKHVIQEPNIWILSAETALIVALISFAVLNIVKMLRSH